MKVSDRGMWGIVSLWLLLALAIVAHWLFCPFAK